MITTFLIKTALLRFGVVIQDVKFDVDNEVVVVNYTHSGEQQSKKVPFEDVEKLFTSEPEAPAARLSKNNGPTGP